MKLDRSAHNTYHIKNQEKDGAYQKNLSFEERIDIFNYLQSVAYNFELNNYPKMDKSIHSCRKHG